MALLLGCETAERNQRQSGDSTPEFDGVYPNCAGRSRQLEEVHENLARLETQNETIRDLCDRTAQGRTPGHRIRYLCRIHTGPAN